MVCEKYAYSEKPQPDHHPQDTVHMSKIRVFFLKSLIYISGVDKEKANVKRVGIHIVEVFTRNEKECVWIKQFLLFIHLCTYTAPVNI